MFNLPSNSLTLSLEQPDTSLILEYLRRYFKRRFCEVEDPELLKTLADYFAQKAYSIGHIHNNILAKHIGKRSARLLSRKQLARLFKE